MIHDLHYRDNLVEAVCRGDRAVIHDREANRYFEVPANHRALEGIAWEPYKSRITRPALGAIIASFCILCITSYSWFFAYTPSRLTLGSAAVIFLWVIVNIAAHESAHILAMRLCGRRVEKMGFKLNYGILPAFYVRMNQVLLLDRREKTFCHLAGPWMNLLLNTSVIAFFATFRPPDSLSNAIYIVLATLAPNFLPILNSDGQKVLMVLCNVSKPRKLRNAPPIILVIHALSVLAAIAIPLRLCYSLITVYLTPWS